MGCHCVEIIKNFVGKQNRPVEAMCWSDTLVHPVTAEDYAIALVRFESGAIGQIEVSGALHGYVQRHVRRNGSGPRTTRDLHIRDSIPHQQIGDLEPIEKEVMPDGTTKRLRHDPETGRVTQQVDAYSLNGYEQHVKNQGRIRWNRTTRSGLTIAQSWRNHESCTSPLAQQGDPFIPARDHPPLP
jgi:predicted dehydrogenase